MSRLFWMLALGAALGGPPLQWASGLFEAVVAGSDAGGRFDPNGDAGAETDAGSRFDPNGQAETDAGNRFDPDG